MFAATNRGSTSKHSLSLLVGAAHLSRYTALHEVFVDQLELLARQLQALLDVVPPARAYAAFGARLERVVVQLERLAVPPLVAPPPLDSTFLGERFGRALDANFMARVVTSMLQTQGCCVVAGSADVDNINLLIRSLLLFVSADDRARCALARAPPGVPLARSIASGASTPPPPPTAIAAQFVPNLVLQGVVGIDSALAAQLGDDEGAPASADAGLRDELVVTSLRPTTLVLLESGTVRQTVRFGEYATARRDCQRHAIAALLAVAATPDVEPTQWQNRLFSRVCVFFID